MESLVALVLAIAFVATTECSVQLPYTEAQLEFLASVKFEQLPRDLQIAIRKTGRDGDSSNWCCVNNVPIKSLQRTKVALTNVKVTTSVKVGYTKCNFMGMMMCPTYDVRYANKAEYHIEYYEVPDPTTCKEVDIRCCDNHMPLVGTCLSMDSVGKYTDQILKLQAAGLLG